MDKGLAELYHSFPFQEILYQFTGVATCIVMNKEEASKIGCRFAFLQFYFYF